MKREKYIDRVSTESTIYSPRWTLWGLINQQSSRDLIIDLNLFNDFSGLILSIIK